MRPAYAIPRAGGGRGAFGRILQRLPGFCRYPHPCDVGWLPTTHGPPLQKRTPHADLLLQLLALLQAGPIDIHNLTTRGSAGDGPWSLRFYRGSRRPNGAPTSVEAAGWRKLDDAVVALESALRLPPLEQFQSPRALFDAQGRPLEALEDLRRAPVAFFLEIGVWIWPPVRVGFEQEVQGVNGKRAVLRTLSLRPKVLRGA